MLPRGLIEEILLEKLLEKISLGDINETILAHVRIEFESTKNINDSDDWLLHSGRTFKVANEDARCPLCEDHPQDGTLEREVLDCKNLIPNGQCCCWSSVHGTR